MSTNITRSEWKETEARIVQGLAVRWPWAHSGGLRVGNAIVTARARLEHHHREDWSTVNIKTDQCGTVMGGLAEVVEAARLFAEVRDAMSYLHSETSHLRVWDDGSCPCGYCGSRGVSHGRPCERCGGTGKR